MVFLGVLKNIENFRFLAQAQPAQAIFNAGSACVGNFLAQAQHAQKTKMANICRSLPTKLFFSPVLKSPTHTGFTDVKKNGSKISHLGTFNVFVYILLVSCSSFYILLFVKHSHVMLHDNCCLKFSDI